MKPEVIFQQVPYKLMLNIDNKSCIYKICRNTGSTYSRANVLITLFKDENLVQSDKKGREIIPIFTEKGREIEEMIELILRYLGDE